MVSFRVRVWGRVRIEVRGMVRIQGRVRVRVKIQINCGFSYLIQFFLRYNKF